MSAAVRQGDQVGVTCSHVNTTGQAVPFGRGEASSARCLVGMYRKPNDDPGNPDEGLLTQCINN